jgi:hypothetical protein
MHGLMKFSRLFDCYFDVGVFLSLMGICSLFLLLISEKSVKVNGLSNGLHLISEKK